MCTLKELIDWLESKPADAVVPHGFGYPMSFRGSYYELAFDPTDNVTISDMLNYAKSAMGNTFEGYKGGEYTMGEDTPCWISPYGESGKADQIGQTLLKMWDWAINAQSPEAEG